MKSHWDLGEPCLIRLKRIGDADGKAVETQLRSEIPAIGDVIEVAVDGTSVPARVIEIGPPDVQGHCTIEVDELSSSYILDTFSTLAQLDSGESQFDTRSSVPARKPPPNPAALAQIGLTPLIRSASARTAPNVLDPSAVISGKSKIRKLM